MAIVLAECDCVVCPNVPAADLGAVGDWYRDFGQVETAELLRLLAATRPVPVAGGDGWGAAEEPRSEAGAGLYFAVAVPA